MIEQEQIVWAKIQQRDEQAFERYYKEHHQAFFLMACRYLSDRRIATEVVNDVFLGLWEKAGTIQIETSLKSYIYRAIINRSINVLNKEKNNARNWQAVRLPPAVTAESRQMEENELRLQLYKAIDQLPEQCRNVFRMSRFEELKQQEIANRLGISLKTVKNHITHALRQLERILINQALWWLCLLPAFIFQSAIGPWTLFFV